MMLTLKAIQRDILPALSDYEHADEGTEEKAGHRENSDGQSAVLRLVPGSSDGDCRTDQGSDTGTSERVLPPPSTPFNCDTVDSG